MASQRHPISRVLEAFGALTVIVMALATAVLLSEAHKTFRLEAEGARLSAIARSAGHFLDLEPVADAGDGRISLPAGLGERLASLALAGSRDGGVSVLTRRGQVIWSAGATASHATALGPDGPPPAGEARTVVSGDRMHAVATDEHTGWSVLVSSRREEATLSPLLLRDVGLLLLLGLILFYIGYRIFDSRILAPLAAAEGVMTRVARGDLTIPETAIQQIGGGPLTDSVRDMVQALTRLAGAIRAAADESAALGEEISAATEEMSASTGEVAGTTGELTDRATRQAQLVRSVSEDAGRILAIAQELASGAMQAVERNAAVTRLAQRHRDGLGATAAGLDHLAEEVARGTSEAEDLAHAAEEIEAFVSQTGAIARQTHVLSLNAAIEAARAGVDSQGLTTIADEVRRLAGEAGQAAATTRDTVQRVAARLRGARDRLLRLGEGGLAARQATQTAMEGLEQVSREAVAADEWTRGISRSADEVRQLIDAIARRTTEMTAGTEDVAAAAQEIAAAAEQLNAGTEEISASATRLADASVRLTEAAGGFRL